MELQDIAGLLMDICILNEQIDVHLRPLDKTADVVLGIIHGVLLQIRCRRCEGRFPGKAGKETGFE